MATDKPTKFHAATTLDATYNSPTSAFFVSGPEAGTDILMLSLAFACSVMRKVWPVIVAMRLC